MNAKRTTVLVIAIVTIGAMTARRFVDTMRSDGNDSRRIIAGDPAVGKVEAVAAARAYLSEWTDSPHEVIAEARLMGMGEYDAISGSADGIPESWTNRDVNIQSDPVWVVVLGVAGNLSHTEFIQTSAEMRQYFLGEAGESFMWPDGTSRAVMVFDATKGDLLAKSIIAPDRSDVYDRIVAYPTSLP